MRKRRHHVEQQGAATGQVQNLPYRAGIQPHQTLDEFLSVILRQAFEAQRSFAAKLQIVPARDDSGSHALEVEDTVDGPLPAVSGFLIGSIQDHKIAVESVFKPRPHEFLEFMAIL